MIVLSFILLVLLNKDLIITKPMAGIIVGSFLVLAFGLLDDIKKLSWRTQLFFQTIIAAAAISLGVKSDYIASPLGEVINLENPILYLTLYVLYFLLFMNALNWLDGVDGLSGGVTFVALTIVFALSFKPEVNQPAVAILCAIGGGAVAGFLFYNFSPARILAGTSGAMFFGFILASLSIFAGAKIATVLMVTIIPILDLLSVVWERYASGRSIFFGDRGRHLHFKLLKLGMSERKIAFVICSASALMGILALRASQIEKIIIVVLFSAGYFWFLNGFLKQKI